MEEGIVKRLKLIDDEYQKRKKAIAKQKVIGRWKMKKPDLVEI